LESLECLAFILSKSLAGNRMLIVTLKTVIIRIHDSFMLTVDIIVKLHARKISVLFFVLSRWTTDVTTSAPAVDDGIGDCY
jgi:hypothetical protein